MSSQFSENSAYRLPIRTALKTSVAALAGTLLWAASASAESPNVVTSIKPVHSIASAIMDGVGSPHILIDGTASPHGFALKPSQAFVLQGADVVFWIGPELSSSLEKPIASMASDAVVVELMEAKGVEHLEVREGANFDEHGHDHDADEDHDDHAHEGHDHDDDDHKEGEDHAGHDDHDHDDEHKHDHETAGHDDHDHSDHEEETHAGHDDHGHDNAHGEDPHIWLNPDNGIAIAATIRDTLSEMDPDHAAKYSENFNAFETRIKALTAEVASEMDALKDPKFIVFHDAYHYFEHKFDTEASGSVTVSPEMLTSADRVADIQKKVKDIGVTCVFQEPQFDPKLVNVVIEGSDAKVGTLDPLGTTIDNGPDLYPKLIKSIADAMKDCLS